MSVRKHFSMRVLAEAAGALLNMVACTCQAAALSEGGNAV